MMKFLKLERAFNSRLLACLLIVLTCAVIYSNSLDGPFLFDDNRAIAEKEKIREVSNFLRFDQIRTKRPFVDLTFALNYRFGQLNVRPYHVINVLIHMMTGVIVYFLSCAILRRLLRPTGDPRSIFHHESQNTRHNAPIPLIGLFTALIFVTHPLQTQAVTYICQRYASLAALFYLTSVLCYLKGRMVQRARISGEISGKKIGLSEVRRSRYAVASQLFVLYFLCVLSGILAFLSKQNAASLPLAIILVEVLCIDNSWAGWKKKLPWAGLALLLMVIAVLLVTGKMEGMGTLGDLLEDISRQTRGQGSEAVVTRWNYLCTQFTVVILYIRLLFLPLGQNADPMLPFKTGFFDGTTPLAFLFFLAIILFAIRVRKKMPALTFGIFWFFITLSVESSVITIKDAMFEHRLYLPMFGFAVGLSATVFQRLSRHPFWAVVLLICATFVLGGATYHRNRVWQSAEAFWTDVLSKSPHNFRAHTHLGAAFLKGGKIKDAHEHFQESLRLKADADAHYNLGLSFERLGDLGAAEGLYRKAVEMDPGQNKALENLGVILSGQGKFEEAARFFEQALKVDPRSFVAHVNLGFARMNREDMDGAMQSYSEALKLDPESPLANFYLGAILARIGNPNAAKPYLLKALEIQPGWAMAHRELGLLLAGQKDLDGALVHFSEVIRVNPESAEAHFHLGLALAQKGDLEGGIREFSEAVRLEPTSMKYVNYLEQLSQR